MSDDPRLIALLARREEMQRRGETVCLEDLCDGCPDLLPRLRQQIEQTVVQRTLELPGDLSSEPQPPSTVAGSTDGTPPPESRIEAIQVPGYEIMEELGRGGMGVVYKARHLRLNRLVALKMVLAGAHASPQQLARFQIEAESVASLHHPNIVQVYEVGEHNHCPYLALEFVEAGNLEGRLRGSRLPPDEAAQLAEQLSRAMHIAHLRGIIHRDLKPANVLLAGDGTPKISDFGLAKKLDEGRSQTRSGSVLGTPSYMAPEQALGKVRDLGPHSDVYSLGAILYECLAGRPPFQAESVMQTLALVQTEEVTPPSQVARAALPRDLETICLKCLQKAPARRYASTEDLADDLRRFLHGEPITARRVSRVERLGMWIKRRPAAAGLVGVTLTAAIAIVALGFWSHMRVRDQRDRAERRTAIARRAIDDMYVKVAEHWLGDEPEKDELQHEFLLKAAQLYEQLADEDENDPGLRRETGKAQFRMGQIYRQLDRFAEAKTAFGKAIDIQKALVQASPGVPEYRQDLANTHNWRGELYRTANQPAQARADYAEAMRLQKEFVAQFPQERAFRHELGRTHYNHALLLAALGENEAARKEHAEAIRELESVCNQCGDEAGPPQDLARAYLNLGALLRKLKEFREAKTAYQQALSRLRNLHRIHANKPEYRFELAAALNNLGNLEGTNLNNPTAAMAALEEARTLLVRLAEDFPARPRYTEQLANSCNSLGAIQAGEKLYAEAEQSWKHAVELFQHLAGVAGKSTYDLGMARGNLGWLYHRHLANPTQARQHLEAATALLAEAARKQPEAGIWSDRGPFVKYLGEAAMARKDEPSALAAARDLAGEHGDDRDRYAAAVLLARCATAEKDYPQRSQSLADEAVAALRRVEPKRFPRALQADTDPALSSLTGREDFRKLVESWKAAQNRP